MLLFYLTQQTKLIILVVTIVLLILWLIGLTIWNIHIEAKLENLDSDIDYVKTKLMRRDNK